MRGDETQRGVAPGAESRESKGPRHAAPRKSLLNKLQIPVGKTMALAAMPTAVFVGMGMAPKLAVADDKEIPFAPGPCVTRSDEPEESASPTPSKSPSPSASPTATPSPSASGKPEPGVTPCGCQARGQAHRGEAGRDPGGEEGGPVRLALALAVQDHEPARPAGRRRRAGGPRRRDRQSAHRAGEGDPGSRAHPERCADPGPGRRGDPRRGQAGRRRGRGAAPGRQGHRQDPEGRDGQEARGVRGRRGEGRVRQGRGRGRGQGGGRQGQGQGRGDEGPGREGTLPLSDLRRPGPGRRRTGTGHPAPAR